MIEPSEVVSAVTARITLPDDRPIDVDSTLTGEIRALAVWWQSLAAERRLVARDLTSPQDLPADAIDALAAGVLAVDNAVDAGSTLLVPRSGSRDLNAAHVLISLLTRAEAQAVVPQPPGLSDRQWMSAVAEVRDGGARLANRRGEPLVMLDELPAPGIAFCVGALLSAAARRTPCIVDGTDELAAAVVAARLSTSATSWWIAGSQSPDPARQAAADRVGLRPGLPLALTDDSGWGARSTIAMLQLALDGHGDGDR